MSAGAILAALAAVALVARTIVRFRRGKSGKRKLAAWTVLAAALGAYAAGLLPTLPPAEKILGDLAGVIGVYAYPLVGLVAFLETGAFLGVFTPGELSVLLGGVVAGRGDISIVPLIGLVWLCSALGDSTGYAIGRRLGRSFLLRRGERFHLGPERLERVEGFFDRRGGATVVLGRFAGVVRTIAPFVAGSSRMPYRRFLPYSLLGTGLWSATWCLAGYFFYASFARIAEVAGRTSGVVAGVIVATAVGVYAYRRLRHPEERDALRSWLEQQSERPGLRPFARAASAAGRVVAPVKRTAAAPGRFLLRRVSPGGLGIELTSALVAALAGLYVFAFYAALLAPAPRLVTPLDKAALGVVAVLPGELLVTLAEVFGPLATPWPAAALVALAAAVLFARRRPHEATALIVGYASISLALVLAKAGVDRVRPTAIVDAWGSSSYPSAHAAYATTYAVIALTAARRTSGRLRRVLLVSLGVLLAVALSLARVELRVSYLSDVSGGFGLGVGVYALCAAAAIVLGHLSTPDKREGGSRTAAAEPATSLRSRGTRE